MGNEERLGIVERVLLKAYIIADRYIVNARQKAQKAQLKSLGVGVRIEGGVVFNRPENISIGESTYVGFDCVFDAYDNISIGSDCQIARNCKFISGNHSVKKGEKHGSNGYVTAPIIIEDNVWIGFNAVILPGVKVGSNSVIGAGSVVTKSFPADSLILSSAASLKSVLY